MQVHGPRTMILALVVGARRWLRPPASRAMELPYTIFALGDAHLHRIQTSEGKVRRRSRVALVLRSPLARRARFGRSVRPERILTRAVRPLPLAPRRAQMFIMSELASQLFDEGPIKFAAVRRRRPRPPFRPRPRPRAPSRRLKREEASRASERSRVSPPPSPHSLPSPLSLSLHARRTSARAATSARTPSTPTSCTPAPSSAPPTSTTAAAKTASRSSRPHPSRRSSSTAADATSCSRSSS